jgi:hypothetical protein
MMVSKTNFLYTYVDMLELEVLLLGLKLLMLVVGATLEALAGGFA